jgi:hypothetical protein
MRFVILIIAILALFFTPGLTAQSKGGDKSNCCVKVSCCKTVKKSCCTTEGKTQAKSGCCATSCCATSCCATSCCDTGKKANAKPATKKGCCDTEAPKKKSPKTTGKKVVI